ncbi:hypothetical protein [Bacteroides sp. 519]|uniref:hypothetical protein n=1 Tax=Bacteroides sp. 519 TaxID=2302937 RepID=UPI0013D38D3E|nr:hypothetical protein [Bacteroides sp. 519]NDV56981.1 hypothetical protein [Bacteroides sp. 519]
MYTSTIGKIFLNAYNKRYNASYSAESFFKEIYIPLFFDHPKYMMTAGNSPLENPKLSWEDMIKGKKPFETPERRTERISKMYDKIANETASDTIARGYAVADDTAGTSGQKTSIITKDNKDSIYLSWIGEGLAIGVSGGVSILFDHESILLDIYDGWKFYRQWLENMSMLKGNQINTWNGQWITHRYDREYDKFDPMFGYNPLTSTDNTNEVFSIPTIGWVKVLLKISSYFPENNLIGYLYNIGQTNTTIGFIPFDLSGIRKPNEFYKKIFGEAYLNQHRKQIEDLYGTAYGIRSICQLGSVGVRAMEPKDIKSYLPTTKGVKKIAIKEETQKINFNTYLIWIIAMLNNEKLWELSQNAAKLLLQYEAGAGKAKKDRTNHVNTLLESTSSKQFLQNMIPLIEEFGEEKAAFEELGKIVHTMPKDNFPYFNTLIRFQYALLNN